MNFIRLFKNWNQLMDNRDYLRSLVCSMVDRIGALLASEGILQSDEQFYS